MAGDRIIDIRGDASGNVIVTGNNNVTRVVIVQNTRFVAPVPGENPYRGLQAFEERHALVFFGRENITSRLWEMSAELIVGGHARFLAILGRSGSGKSSVVRAGLLPMLAHRQWPDTDVVGAAICVPGDDPLTALDDAISRARYALNNQLAGRHRILIVADQFETLFTGRASGTAKTAFVERVISGATDSNGEILFVATLRSDFLGALQPYPDLERLLCEPRHHRIVTSMSRLELAAAIAGPMGRTRPLPQTLVDWLVDQADGREGALPLLQYTLTQIWEAMAKGVEPGEYFTTALNGSIASAIAKEGDLLLAELKDPRRTAIALRAFTRMVELHGQSLIRRPIMIRSLVRRDETANEVAGVLRHFAERRARLVTLSADIAGMGEEDEVVASIAHEALITSWPTLFDLVTSNPADQTFHREVESDANRWNESHRPRGSLYRPPALDLLRDLVKRRPDEITAVELDFFEASQRAWRRFRRLRFGAIVAVLVLALAGAGVASYIADEQTRLRNDAQQNYKTALDLTAKFTGKLLTDLRERGVSIGGVGQVLQAAEDGLETLQQLHNKEDPDLDRIHSTILFEFAKTYQFAQEGEQARQKAEQSLKLRDSLATAEQSNPDLQWQFAESLELRGDLLRSEKHDWAAARTDYEKVLSIRGDVAGPSFAQKAIGLSQIHIRLGDLDRELARESRTPEAKKAKLEDPRTRYRSAFDVVRVAVAKQPGNRELQRELSWDYNKLSDIAVETDKPEEMRQALGYVYNSLCIRRHLAYRDEANAPLADPRNTELRDVSWTLDRIAVLKLNLKDPRSAEGYYADSLGLRKYLSDKDISNVLFLSDVATSEANFSKLYVGDMAETYLGERPRKDDELAAAVLELRDKVKSEPDVHKLKLALAFAQASLSHRRPLLADTIAFGDAPQCSSTPQPPSSVSKQNWRAYCQFQPLFQSLCDSYPNKTKCLEDSSWQPIVSDRERDAYNEWARTVSIGETCLDDIMRDLEVDKPGDQETLK